MMSMMHHHILILVFKKLKRKVYIIIYVQEIIILVIEIKKVRLLLKVQILVTGVDEEIEIPVSTMTIGNSHVNFSTFEVMNVQTKSINTLTKREIELLDFFNKKVGLVVSREEILDALWGNDQFPTSRTIDNYILGFRKLFEIDPKNPQFFHSIRGVGYKFTLQ